MTHVNTEDFEAKISRHINSQDHWKNHHKLFPRSAIPMIEIVDFGDLLKIIRGIITNYSHDQSCFR